MSALSPATLLALAAAFAYSFGQSAQDAPSRPDTPEDLVPGDSEEFFRRLQSLSLEELQPEELWPLFERCDRELAGTPGDVTGDAEALDLANAQTVWMREYRCAAIATALAARGENSDCEALWRAFDSPETTVEIREGIVRGMLERRLEEAAAGTAKAAISAPILHSDPLLAPLSARHAALARRLERTEPSWFGTGAADLREAWRIVSSTKNAYLRATFSLAGAEPASFTSDSEGFLQAVADYLRGRLDAAEAIQRIGRFEWGSWCGTGSGTFHEPRDRAMLLMLIDLGRVELATGALLAVAHGEEGAIVRRLSEEGRGGVLWHHLANRLGLDWELLAIGSLLDGDRIGATAVAQHGSERGARLLLQALEQPAPEGAGDRLGDDETALAALATLVAPAEGCSGYASSSLDHPRVAGELPGDVQLEALEALAGRVADASGLELASEAARQLHRLCRGESLRVFEVMSRSRFSAVREHAARARHSLSGVEIEVSAAPPVDFRVLVDGVPWQGAVESTISRGSWMTSEARELDAQGRLRLDRDLFLDWKAAVRSVRVETPGLDGTADTWFVARVPAPRVLSAVTEIAVETQRLTLVLSVAQAGRCGDGGCTVRVEAETPLAMPLPAQEGSDTDGEYWHFEPIASDRPLHAAEPWIVRVVRGLRYRAVVEQADRSWTSPAVVPEAEPLTLTLRGDRLHSLEEQALALVEASRSLSLRTGPGRMRAAVRLRAGVVGRRRWLPPTPRSGPPFARTGSRAAASPRRSPRPSRRTATPPGGRRYPAARSAGARRRCHAVELSPEPGAVLVAERLEGVASAGITLHDRGPLAASLRLRYFGPRPLVEDDSVRSKASTTLNARLGWELSPRFSLDLDAFNLTNAKVSDVDYYYASRLPGEPLVGIDDIHTHPLQPFRVRLSFTGRF